MRRAKAALVVVAWVIWLVTIVWTLANAFAPSEPEEGPNSPLDRIGYQGPAFAEDSWKVVDRFTGRQWWLVRMDGQYVTLEIGD